MCTAWDGERRHVRLHSNVAFKHERVAKGWDVAMDKRTVLVVDDDPSIRELVAELLDEAGFAVLEADSGGLALRLAREHCPSVVLMDHRLPDMSGLDVLERLRTQRASRHIPVVLVSGFAYQLVDRDRGPTSSSPSRSTLRRCWSESNTSRAPRQTRWHSATE